MFVALIVFELVLFISHIWSFAAFHSSIVVYVWNLIGNLTTVVSITLLMHSLRIYNSLVLHLHVADVTNRSGTVELVSWCTWPVHITILILRLVRSGNSFGNTSVMVFGLVCQFRIKIGS